MEENSLEMYLSVLNRLMRNRLNEELAPLGLAENNFMIIIRLYHHPGISQKELNQLIYRNHSIVTKQITRLQQLGYVKMEVDPQNKTRRKLFLTPKAQAIYPEILTAQKQANTWLSAELVESETAQLQTLLARLFEAKQIVVEETL